MHLKVLQMYKLRRSAPLALQGSAARATALLQKFAFSPTTHQVHTSTTLAEIKRESTSGPGTPPHELHSEKQVKYGVNTPRSAGEFAKEASHTASGIVESLKDTIKVTATAIKRTLGMEEKPMSNSSKNIHGAAGKMQHAPPEVGRDLPAGGPAASRAHAQAKYQEIADTEKPHFPRGEQSVNELYPDMTEAAKLQNQGGEKGSREKVQERVGGVTFGENEKYNKESDKEQLNKTMHDLGP